MCSHGDRTEATGSRLLKREIHTPLRQRYTLPMQSTFISYGGPDEPFAERLNKFLSNQGVRTFFFKDHAIPGQKLHRVMRNGVNEHDRVILVCSRSSLTRAGVLNEIEETLARESRNGGAEYLIPIRLDDFVFTDEWAGDKPGIRQAVLDRVVADFSDSHDPSSREAVEQFNRQMSRLTDALRKQAEPSEASAALGTTPGQSTLVTTPSSAASPQVPDTAALQRHAVLPLVSELRDDGDTPVVPRCIAVWVEPQSPLRVSRGRARNALASACDARSPVTLPFMNGEMLAHRRHPVYGEWLVLSHVGWEQRCRNQHQYLATGVSDSGVLAWQHEDAAFDLSRDIVHLDWLVESVAHFVLVATRFYQQALYGDDSTSLLLRVAIDTPRPEKTVVETAPFFRGELEARVSLKVSGLRQEAETTFGMATSGPLGGYVDLTWRLLNDIVAGMEAQSFMQAFDREAYPRVATISRPQLVAFLRDRGFSAD